MKLGEIRVYDDEIIFEDPFRDKLAVSVGQLPGIGLGIIGIKTDGPTSAPILTVPEWRQLVRLVEDRITGAYIPWHCARCNVDIAMRDLPDDEAHACSRCDGIMDRVRAGSVPG